MWTKSYDVTIQMKALCLYLHMVIFACQNFTKWSLEIWSKFAFGHIWQWKGWCVHNWHMELMKGVIDPLMVFFNFWHRQVRENLSTPLDCKTVGFFSKSVKKSVKRGVRVLRARSARAPHALSLAFCFQPRSRPFVWLLAHTWILTVLQSTTPLERERAPNCHVWKWMVKN